MASTSVLSAQLDRFFLDITSNFSPKERMDVVKSTKGTLHGKFERLPDDDLYACLKLLEKQGHLSENRLTLIEGFVAQKSNSSVQIKEKIEGFKASRHPESVDKDKLQGRGSDLQKIMEKLKKGEKRVVNLHGSAGVGKTTLANEVCTQWRGEHITVDLRGAKEMRDVYLKVMHELDPTAQVRVSDIDINFIVKSVREKLQEQRNKTELFLLFLDNVDQFAEGKSKEAKNLNIAFLQFLEKLSQLVSLGKMGEFKVLLTSRNQFIRPEIVENFEVKSLDNSVSEDLLQSYGKVTLDTAERKKLADLCKGTPLLLKGLAAILRQEAQSPKELINKIEQEAKESKSEKASTEETVLQKAQSEFKDDGVDVEQMSSLKEMFDSLPSDDFRVSAMSLSLFCSPFSVTQASVVLGIKLTEATFLLEGLRTSEIISAAALESKELLYDIHPLLKKYANSIQSGAKYKAQFEKAEGRFCKLFIDKLKEPARLLDSDYIAAFNKFETDRMNYELACEISLKSEYHFISSEFHELALIASLFDAMLSGKTRRMVFQSWAEMSPDDGKAGSLNRAKFKCWEALQVLNVDGPHMASKLLEEVTTSLSHVLDKDCEEYCLSQGLFFFTEGEVFYSDRNYTKALDSFESALKLLEVLKAHTTLARCLNSIGNCHFSVGRPRKALEYFQQAYDMRKALSGSELHFDMPVYKNQIGAVLENQGEYEEAIKCYEDALELLKKVKLTGNLDEAQFYRNISNAFSYQDKFKEALEPAHKAYEIRERVLGKHHLTVRSLFQIAVTQANMMEHELALEYFQRAWTMEKELKAGNHSEVWHKIITGVEDMCDNLRERAVKKDFEKEVLEFLQHMWENEKQFQGFGFTPYNQEIIDTLTDRIGNREEARALLYKYEREALWFYQNMWETFSDEKEFLVEFDQEEHDKTQMLKDRDDVLDKVISLSEKHGLQEEAREYKKKKVALYRSILLTKPQFFGKGEYEKAKFRGKVEQIYYELDGGEKVVEFQKELLSALEGFWKELKHSKEDEKERETNIAKERTVEEILSLCNELKKRDLFVKYGKEALEFYEKLWKKKYLQMKRSEMKKFLRHIENLALSIGDSGREMKYREASEKLRDTGQLSESSLSSEPQADIPVSKMQEEDEIEVEIDAAADDGEENEENKILLRKDVVNEEGATWNIICGAAHVKFPPDAISETRLITVHRWEPEACSPSLQNHEYLVSNVIELSAVGIDDLEFSEGVRLMISHSSTRLEGYEVVIKQLVTRESNEWEDLETTDIKQFSDIEEECTSPDDVHDLLFPAAEAEITKCSCYAVVCRLKAYKYEITSKPAVFTIPDYPEVTLVIPKNAVKLRRKIPITLRVHDVPLEDFRNKDMVPGPVLRIECQHVEFLQPVEIRLPVSLEEGRRNANPVPAQSRVRLLFLPSDGEEWREITEDLVSPLTFDESVVKFQVTHFSGFWFLHEWCAQPLKNIFSFLCPPPRFPALFTIQFIEQVDRDSSKCLVTWEWAVYCAPPDKWRQLVDETIPGSKLMDESALMDMAPKEKAYVFFSGGAERVIEEDTAEMKERNDFFVRFNEGSQFKRCVDVRLKEGRAARVKFCLSQEVNDDELLCDMTIRIPQPQPQPQPQCTPVEFFGVPLDDPVLLSLPVRDVLVSCLSILEKYDMGDSYKEKLKGSFNEERVIKEFFSEVGQLDKHAQDDFFHSIVSALRGLEVDVARDIIERLTIARNVVMKPCPNEVVNIVSREISTEWKRLAREVEVTDEIIDAIQEEETDDHERCRSALRRFRERKGENATTKDVMFGLTRIGCAHVNREIIKELIEPYLRS